MTIVLDLSKYQGPAIPWGPLAAASIRNVIIKVGSAHGPDPMFRPNWAAAANYGFHRSGYWFAYPDLSAGATQAHQCCDLVGPLGPGDGLALDLESSPGHTVVASDVPWAVEWCRTVINRTGVRPLFYVNASTLRAFDWTPVRDLGCPLWVSAYGQNTGAPIGRIDPAPWPKWALWQFTSKGVPIPGFGPVDLSLLDPQFPTLAALGRSPTEAILTVSTTSGAALSIDLVALITHAYDAAENHDGKGVAYWVLTVAGSDDPLAVLAAMYDGLGLRHDLPTTTNGGTPT